MRAKTHRLLVPAALAATLVASPLAWSGQHRDCGPGDMPPPQHHGDRGEMMKHRFNEMAERLKLTEAQRGQVLDIFKKSREDRKAQFEALRDQDRPMLNSGDPTSDEYKDRVETAAKQAADSARRRVEARAERYQAIYKVLNDEQRQAWANMQEERELFGGPEHHGPGPKDSHGSDDRDGA
ncbi:hypothetical protein EZI54_14260 [Marinobacter halodurans]|uniref:Periplasmic heavy metal sensor n=1 Tax=Marinobacter halodurans TaxID=2528979 RepID=A0ABY1ZIC3_9GAMM|nr:Spy/CpxP family protein refolding chaperone [Marinobacter halodurans]TBW54273.1 hypothetical protein EZI54_14260 [Marinobacter halodurans]